MIKFRVWLEELGHTKAYGILRILVGLLFVLKLFNFNGLYSLGNDIVHIDKLLLLQKFNFTDQFRAVEPVFSWVPLFSHNILTGLTVLLFIVSVMVVVGYKYKISALTQILLHLYFLIASGFTYTFHSLLFLLVFILLYWGRAGDIYSVDTGFANKMTDKVSLAPLRLIQVTVCVYYLAAFVMKFNSAWLSGSALADLSYFMEGTIAQIVKENINIVWMGIGVVLTELFLIFAFWFRRTIPFAIIVGVLFHIAIDAVMWVSVFSYLMIVLYLSFILDLRNVSKKIVKQ